MELISESQMDRSGRLKLETVDDLFNILQLRKKRRQRKTPIHKKHEPEPEAVVRSPFFTFYSLFIKTPETFLLSSQRQ